MSARHVRIFKNGRNQAIRIPRELELPTSEATSWSTIGRRSPTSSPDEDAPIFIGPFTDCRNDCSRVRRR